MTEDSEIQLVQARSDTLADWHPIIMALIWRPIDAVVPGPLGMLLLFLGLYWGAFYMLTRQALAISRLHATAMSLLPFLPFLANFAGTIWKDVLVFGSFMAAIALAGTTTPARLLAAIIGFLLVWIGALARHNAGLAAVPILVLLLWPQAASPLVLIRRLCAAMAVLALLLLGSVAIMTRAYRRYERRRYRRSSFSTWLGSRT